MVSSTSRHDFDAISGLLSGLPGEDTEAPVLDAQDRRWLTEAGPLLNDEDRRWLAEWDRDTRALSKPSKPAELLESQAIHWRRDFDAVLIGFVLGVLATLAVQGVW